MMKEKINNLEVELRKNRIQSYFFLAMILLGTLLCAYLFYNLEQTKDNLEQSKKELEEKNEFIESLNSQLHKQDSICKEINKTNEKIITQLESQSGINTSTNSAIQEEMIRKNTYVKAQQKEVKKERNLIAKNLFSANESVRKSARNQARKEISKDGQILTELLEYSCSKTDMKNKEAVWQMIYLLTTVNPKLLRQAQNKELITKFLNQAEAANLIGTKTAPLVKKIESKMK